MASERPILKIPTAQEVKSLKVGDLALNAFGQYAPVTEISYRSVDVEGAPFVGYYTSTNGGAMSATYKAGELVRTVAASRRYKSAELDAIERDMRKKGEHLR